MNAGSIFFFVCTLLCLVGAFTVVLAHNPIRGALGLLTTIVGIAGLFLRLSAEFLAAMQVLVYAGAVVILFVFVVMVLGPNSRLTERSTGGARILRIFSGALIAVVGIAVTFLFAGGTFHDFEVVGKSHGTVEAVGGLMFSEGLVPFEIATVLLIVAVIGAIAVARTKPSNKRRPVEPNPTLRMFHGPLLPRDAERPLGPGTLAERVHAQETSKEGAA
jgi:NADH-quinone oxidoreductase subunit J